MGATVVITSDVTFATARGLMTSATRFLASAAAVLVVGMPIALPAWGQGFPTGSYQRSCVQVHWAGSVLVAECPRMDGRMTGTGLQDARRCTGDIANINGQLQCTAGGPPPVVRGPAPEERRRDYYPDNGPAERYGERRERRERCEELAQREGWLRGRLQAEPWGPERERFEHRLRETHEERERDDCYR